MDRTLALPIHPLTGVRALGRTRRGALIWPVRGGAEVDLVSFLALTAEQRTAHLADLSAEDFAALQAALEAHIAELLASDTSEVADLTAAADARDAVTAETATREEAATAAAAERDAARARLAGEQTDEGETPDGETPPAEGDTPAEGDEPAEGDQQAPVTEEPPADNPNEGAPAAEPQTPATARVPVAAGAPRPASLPGVAASARTTAPRPRPVLRNRGSIVAAAGSGAVAAGSTMTRDQLVEALTDATNGMLRGGTLAENGERRSVVASLRAEYTPERTLSDMEGMDVTTAKMAAVARAAEAAAATPGGLTAAGGLCAPTAVDYSLVDISDDARPVRDGLAQLRVTRGGIRFVPSRKLSDISSGIDQWTVANDLSPSAPATKSRLVLACQTPVEVLLYAVTQRIQFGNINSRAFPEQIDQDLKVLAAAHARKAERLLLGSIKALGKAVSTAKLLGATRDFLAQVDTAAAYLRDQHRMSDNAILELPVSRHVRDAIRADLTRQMADGQEALAVTNEEITAYLTRRNIKPMWTYETAATASGAAFPVQSSAAALVDIPDTIEWDLFPAGSFQYLDGGEIALGAVRDSTLNGTNDYEMFGESFEAVAFRGVESLHVTSTIQPDGSSAGLVNTTGAALSAAVDL